MGVDGVFLYAIGRIVIWVPKDSQLDVDKLGIKALLEPSAHKIAVANPEHAPYGRAAVAALKALNVYDQRARNFRALRVLFTGKIIDRPQGPPKAQRLPVTERK